MLQTLTLLPTRAFENKNTLHSLIVTLAMKYRSTRSTSDQELSFEEAVIEGLAPDGGLFVPVVCPHLSKHEIESWRGLKFTDIAAQLFRKFINPSEISDSELAQIVGKSFATFSHPKVTPLVKVSDNLWILELFHGPTFAFKDVALQVLGNLFEFFLMRRDGGVLNIIGATSGKSFTLNKGDTGGAAIYGLRGKKGIQAFILHPMNRISPIQELQMTTVLDKNIHNVAVEGTFDDCQEIVKTLFSDSNFKKRHSLGAVNSINWARIMAQMSYYFFSYFEVQRLMGVNSKDSEVKIAYR
jgi:threonine synthase